GFPKREPHKSSEQIVPAAWARLHFSALEDTDFVLGESRRRHEPYRRAAAAHHRKGPQGVELVVPGKPISRQASEQRLERREDRRVERWRQASRHPTDSPARSGMSVAAPNGISPGTVQLSLRRVIEPRLRGSR